MLLELGRGIVFAVLFFVIQFLLNIVAGHNTPYAREMALLLSIGVGYGFFIRWCFYGE